VDEKVSKSSKQSGRPGHKKMALIGSVYMVEAYLRSPEQVLAALFSDLRVVSHDSLPARPKPIHKRVRGALLRNERNYSAIEKKAIYGSGAGIKGQPVKALLMAPKTLTEFLRAVEI
jgi:hypothetical protein